MRGKWGIGRGHTGLLGVAACLGALLPALAAAAGLPQGEGRRVRPLVSWTVDGQAVAIPHTWNAKDGCDGPGKASSHVEDDGLWGHNSVKGVGYARKSVTYRCELGERPRPGRRWFVRCEGASVSAKVVFNGQCVARHEGAFTAFGAELTPHVVNHDNVLEITVDNFWDADIPPLCADYTVCGGLYRPVWLIETDRVCIDPVADGADGVRLEADPGTGRVVARVKVLGAADETQTFDFGTVERWSPESPTLYPVTVKIAGPGYRDEVTRRVGFRTAELRADGFYLNGKRRAVRGVNYHQERTGKGWAITPADIEEDLALIREMGADGVRTAHYPHSQAFFEAADRAGLLVWTELPATDEVGTGARYRENLLSCVREMVAQFGDHPSVVMWSLFNEMYIGKKPDGTAEPLLEEANALFKRLDPRRPTVAATCYREKLWLNDIPDALGLNAYPGWYDGTSEMLRERFREGRAAIGRASLCVSEYGCGGSVYQHENPILAKPVPNSDWHPEEYETQHHRVQYALLREMPDCWGFYPWMMFDAAADQRTEGDQPGINDKGLVTRDRRTRKDAFYFYKANWNPEPLLHLCGKRMLRKVPRLVRRPGSGETVRDEAIDVVAFSNVGDVTLSVNGRRIGAKAPDAVRVAEWKGIELRTGLNEIVVEAGGLKDAHLIEKTAAE